MTVYGVIQVRSMIEKKKEFRKTLELLRLFKPNHLVLVTDKQKGMIKKVQDFVAWGEITGKTLEHLLSKRGRLPGGKRLTEVYLKGKGVNSLKELTARVEKDSAELLKLGIKPVFRLNPPSKGFERGGIKKSYTAGGALGYRGKDINELIERMM